MLTVNVLAVQLPINGVTPGEVSDAYPNLFAPAGVTFSIWGIIYFLLLLHTFFQVGIFHSKKEVLQGKDLVFIGFYFSISSIVNSLWIYAWHYKIIWGSFILMMLLFFCLAKIILFLKEKKLPLHEKIFVSIPFQVYFGWITIALIANATVWLVYAGWKVSETSAIVWTIIVLVLGAVIGSITIIRLKSLAYGAVMLWAYWGIFLKHTAENGYDRQYPSIIMTIRLALLGVIIVMLYILVSRKETHKIE